MAIPADTVWEVETTGSDTAAGGGFSIAQKGATGTDMTYPTPAVTTFTSNLSAVGTSTLTCSSALFLNTMLGNVIQISGQGFYCIQGFTSTTVVTVDRALGTFATTSGWVGGALASPGQAGANIVASNKVYVKTGTYSITSASVNISGGCLQFNVSLGVLTGYNTTRTDLTSPPLFQASGIATFNLVTVNSGFNDIWNIAVDGAGLTASRGFNCNQAVLYLCKALNCKNGGFALANACQAIFCQATGCSAVAAFSGGEYFGCEAYGNTFTGFVLGGSTGAHYCIASGNSGASSDGLSMASGSTFSNCVSYGNGRDGFRNTGGAGVTGNFINCIAETNTGIGFNQSAATGWILLLNCAAYNNTGGNTSLGTGFSANLNFVTGLASFFVNAASGNFGLNATASAGAALRAAGVPGLYPRGLTQGYLDVGAAQHTDPVKLLTVAGMTGGME
jgi:hypothetical protein